MFGNLASFQNGGFPASNFYTDRGIVGALPGDYTQHGAGFAALSPEAQTPQGILDYYTRTQYIPGASPGTLGYNAGNRGGTTAPGFNTLNAYLHGTYWKQGKPIPGTNIRNGGQLYTKLFGSSNEGDADYSKLTPERLTGALGPQAMQVLNQARDWEIRDISRKNQQGFSAGGLLGAAGVAGILAPALLAGSGVSLSGLAKNPVSTVKNALTKSLTKANPNAVPGMATGVTTPTGGGLVGSGALNPAAVGLQGGAPLGANALAAAGTAGVTPLAGVPDLTPYFNQQIPGTNQFLGKHTGATDWLTQGAKKLGSELLKKGVNTLAENLLAPDTQTNALTSTSVAGGTATTLPALSGGNTGNPILDRYQYALADQLTGKQDKPMVLPQYQSQKLEPGNPRRIPGYQKRPFANALAV